MHFGIQTPITKKQLSTASLILFLIAIMVRYFGVMARPILFLDESAYLARGVAIVEEGQIPTIASSAGVSLVHAISYMFLRSLPLGMDLAGRVTAFLGGIVLYSTLYFAARRSLGNAWGAVAIGLGLLYFPLYHLDRNSSDLLYASMVGTLLVLLAALERNHISSSLVIGLSFATAGTTLMRNDGFLIFVGLTPLIWIYFRRFETSFFQRVGNLAIHWLLPYAGIIAAMAFLAWRTTGILEILPGARTYTAFEQGAGLVRRFELERKGKNPWIEGDRIAREVYGSREENRGNVWLALSRHPRAWMQRIGWNVRDFFLRWFEEHNGHLATVTLLLSWFGWVGLFTQRRFFLAASIGALLLPTSAYFFITFWRIGYIGMYSPAILFLNTYALALLMKSPGLQPCWMKVIIVSIAAGLGIALMYFAAQYSDYTYGYKGLIKNGITLAEIAGGIAIWAIFAGWLQARGNSVKGLFGIVGVALFLGIWLAGSEDIVSLAWSDKAQAQYAARQEGQNTLRNYIRFAFSNLHGERVCVEDPSLPWYARQEPTVVYELFDPPARSSLMAIARLMEEHRCEYLLWRGGGLQGITGLLEPVFAEGDVLLLKHMAGSGLEGSEIVLDDFGQASKGKWSPFGMNNVQGGFMVLDGALTLAYENNLTRRDIYAYRFDPMEPVANVVALKMWVRIRPGTRLTVDVVKDRELVSPRFLNYYPGTSDWEEIIIPVAGTLHSVTIGMSEPGEGGNTPSYRVEIDWIKAIVEQ